MHVFAVAVFRSRRRRLAEVEGRLTYLDTFFRGRRAVSIGPALVTEYVAGRQQEMTRFERPPSNRTINIELSLLKRMLRFASRNAKLLRVPPTDLLREAPPRGGFFEAHQYEAVRRRLPEDLRAAIAIAYTYGWRKSEILSLERRQFDLKAGTLRLDPGTTKNGEGRIRVPHPGDQRAAGRPGRARGGSTAEARPHRASPFPASQGPPGWPDSTRILEALGDGVQTGGCPRAAAP